MNDIHEEILTKATSLFMKNGYQATSTRQLAEHLDIKQPVLYYYFKNKKALYQQVVTTYAKYLGTALMTISQEPLPAAKRLFLMSEFILNEENLNLAQLMHDMQTVFKGEDNKVLFAEWRHAYLQPFIMVFNDFTLANKMTAQQVTMHFMRILTAYVSVKYVLNGEQEIREMITIFLHGSTLEARV